MARTLEQRRAEARTYAAQKRREAGVPRLGSPESTANRAAARKLTGETHPNWVGGDVTYAALHAWVARHKERTGICERCGNRPRPMRDGRPSTQFANLSGLYERNLDDFAELCIACHVKHDGHSLRHGTSTGYDYYKCRCDECRRANTERKRKN